MQLGNAVIIDDLHNLALDAPAASAAAVYDRPIGIRLLHEDPEAGEEHYLIRYPAGVKGRVHQHSAAHTIVVLDGELDANDRVIGPGSYAHFPADQPMRHQSGGEGGCLFVIMFHGPFDVRILEDAVPGVDPSEHPNGSFEFTIDVDGEQFAVYRSGAGRWSYDWLTGPHPYGFGASGPPVDSREEHRQRIRDFLRDIDPATGYLRED